MKRFSVVITALLVVLFTVAGCAHMQGGEWITLIDGDKGLDNFNRIGKANWRAEGGAIVADKGKGGYLVSKNSYKDFEIYAKGPQITVKLNGAVTVSFQDSSFASGPIALQYGSGPKGAVGGAIKWRKVQVRPL